MRRPLRPTRVRAAAILLALLAHVLLLLLFSFGPRRPSPESELLQFVSIWPPDQPKPAVVTRAPSTSQSRPRATTPQIPPPAMVPTIPDESRPSPESESSPPEQTSRPSVDWYGEAANAAARNATKADQPPTFSPPPKVLRQACKPRESSFKWNPEEKKAGLLPLPWVKVANCVVGLRFFSCDLGGPPAANAHLFDDLKKGDRPVSSVPDPNTCD